MEAVPVTVVCGWQGSGAAGDDGLALRLARAADPGAVLLRPALVAGDDDAIRAAGVEVYRLTEEVAERTPGCDCCAVRVDLIRALATLSLRRRPPTRIVLETLPDTAPAPVAVTILDDPELSKRVRLDGFVTAVDGPTLTTRLVSPARAWPAPVAFDQVLMADGLVLMATERLAPAALALAARFLRGVNPMAYSEVHGATAPRASLLDLRGWSPRQVGAHLEQLCAPLVLSSRTDHGATGSVVLDVPDDLSETGLEEWFEELRVSHGSRLLRVEATLAVSGHERRWLALGTRSVLRFERGPRWRTGERRTSRLRVVGRDLDLGGLASGLSACRAT